VITIYLKIKKMMAVKMMAMAGRMMEEEIQVAVVLKAKQ
jgi:hypothetical protein